MLLLRDPDQQGAVRLLHPFTGDVVELPPLGTLAFLLDYCPAAYRSRRLARVVCASVSLDSAGAITVMLALHEVWRVAYCTSLDQKWTLASWTCPIGFQTLSFQGKLYMVDSDTPSCDQNVHHQVLRIDPPVQNRAGAGRELQPPKLIATIPASKLVYPDGLVECGSEILVLGHNDMPESQILVYKLTDLVLQRFVPTKNISGNTLFLYERNISVSSKVLPTVKGDNVVFERFRPPYLAQYHLSSGSLSPAIDNCSLYGRAQGPSNLVHYIFSCCIRNRWYVGVFALFSFCTVSVNCFVLGLLLIFALCA